MPIGSYSTVGELRDALKECPDDTPLAISTEGLPPNCGSFEVEIDGDCGVTVYGV